VGYTFVNGAFRDTGRSPSCSVALPTMGAVLGGLYLSPSTRGTKIDTFRLCQKPKERSLTEDSNIDSKEGSVSRDPLR
jgi:hypothetical protein